MCAFKFNPFTANFDEVGSGGGGAGLFETDGTNTKLTTAQNIDFQKFKAIAMACDNGATLPSTPVTGQWFLHTPTGRKVLAMYDGTAWIPIISLGATTIYVDGTSGTDSLDLGGATGAGAFATIQYAVDSIGGLVGGNVDINVSSGTYYSTTTVSGKSITGDYFITIKGASSINTSGTATSGSVITLTDTSKSWTTNSLRGKKVKLTLAGSVDEKIIQSNTSNTITFDYTNNFTTDSSTTYIVYDINTIISGASSGTPTVKSKTNCFYILQGSILLEDLEIQYATFGLEIGDGALSTSRGKNLNVHNCTHGILNRNAGKFSLRCVYTHDNLRGFLGTQTSYTNILGVFSYNNTQYGISLLGQAQAGSPATPADGEPPGYMVSDNNASHGIIVETLSFLTPAQGNRNYSRNNGGYGFLATSGGFAERVSGFNYSGNASGTYSPTTSLAGGTN